MSSKDGVDVALRRELQAEFERTVYEAIHYQIEESGQPTVIKPLDLRDDDAWGR